MSNPYYIPRNYPNKNILFNHNSFNQLIQAENIFEKKEKNINLTKYDDFDYDEEKKIHKKQKLVVNKYIINSVGDDNIEYEESISLNEKMPKNKININKNVNNEPLMFKLKKNKSFMNINNNSYRNMNTNILNNIYKFKVNNIIYNYNNKYNNSIQSNLNLEAGKKDEKKNNSNF